MPDVLIHFSSYVAHLASGEVAAEVIFIARVVISQGLFPLLKTFSTVHENNIFSSTDDSKKAKVVGSF